jgi:hypothetical protein
LIPLNNSKLSAYLKDPRLVMKDPRVTAGLKNLQELKDSRIPAYLKDPRYSRYRGRATLAVAAAAAVAGAGVIGASASTAPLSSTLSDAVLAASPGHVGTQAGSDIFGAVSGSHADDDQAADQLQLAADQVSKSRASKTRPGQSTSKGSSALRLPSVQIQPSKKSSPAQPAAAGKTAAGTTAGKTGSKQPAPSKSASKPAPSKSASKPAPTKSATSEQQPYLIYDSVTPTDIPSNQGNVATYANGPFQASWSDVNGRSNVLWIDTRGDNPGANVLDVEPGDATPTQAADWAEARLAAQSGSVAIVYTFRAEWGAVKDAIGTLPSNLQSKVKYWIADPTGVPHVVAGSSATQWYWGAHYDISTAEPGFAG